MISTFRNPQKGFPVTFCKGLRNIQKRGPKHKEFNFIVFIIFCSLVVVISSSQSLEGKGPMSSTLVQQRYEWERKEMAATESEQYVEPEGPPELAQRKAQGVNWT